MHMALKQISVREFYVYVLMNTKSCINNKIFLQITTCFVAFYMQHSGQYVINTEASSSLQCSVSMKFYM